MKYRVKHEIGFQEVNTREDYQEVLLLRERAYAASGKAAPVMSYEQTYSLGDGKVVGFYHRDRLVASFMVRFPGCHALLESVDLPLGHYPEKLPRKEKTIEISKLCIDQEFRKTDLLKMLFEQVHRELVLSRRSSIVICCEERLIRMYRAIGFGFTGFSFQKQERHFEIMVTTQRRFGLYGAHVGPIRWNLFLGEVTRAMLERGEVQPSPLYVALWSLYGFFAPVAILLENRRIKS